MNSRKTTDHVLEAVRAYQSDFAAGRGAPCDPRQRRTRIVPEMSGSASISAAILRHRHRRGSAGRAGPLVLPLAAQRRVIVVSDERALAVPPGHCSFARRLRHCPPIGRFAAGRTDQGFRPSARAVRKDSRSASSAAPCLSRRRRHRRSFGFAAGILLRGSISCRCRPRLLACG